jgi:hypothetical protein
MLDVDNSRRWYEVRESEESAALLNDLDIFDGVLYLVSRS